MCQVCDAEDLEEALIMPNPWDKLSGELLETLKISVHDFIDTEKQEVVDFLREKSVEIAKQTWVSLNGTDEERAEAIGNLRHLKAQVVGQAASMELVATTAAVKLLGKVFEVVVNVALQYGVKLLVAL
jgi:hypothetical protein